MTAYDRTYLEKARIALGRMLDYAIYDMGYELDTFWEMFTSSPVSEQFEAGDVSVIAGRSGIELALMVCGIDDNYPKPRFTEERSEEYWLGWALAYYQWQNCISFSRITDFVPIEEILEMYSPYHEMDVRQFCDKLSEVYKKHKLYTNLNFDKRIVRG